MPPSPAACSITRLLSVMANCPNRKKPSRGAVAIQFGFPRPALRKADCVVFDVFLASLINSSLISNGLSVSSVRRCSSVVSISSILSTIQLAQHEDNDHAPNREQGVTDGISYGV